MINLSVFDNLISFLSDLLYKIIPKNKITIIEKNDPVTLSDAKNNVALGEGTMSNITRGRLNIAFGYNALASTTIGNNNVALGAEALYSNTTGIAGRK